MGGSLGLALRGTREVVGADPDREALRVALAVGAVDRVAGSLEEAADGAEVVVLAAPVPALEGLARRALAAAPEGCLVTDIGSAKAAWRGSSATTARRSARASAGSRRRYWLPSWAIPIRRNPAIR